MKTKESQTTEFTTYFTIEMEVESFTLKSQPSESEQLNAAVGFQLRFVKELLETLSLMSQFAVTSLLADSDDKTNEYEFDHIAMLESFKFLTEFAAKVVHNANIQSKTGVLD